MENNKNQRYKPKFRFQFYNYSYKAAALACISVGALAFFGLVTTSWNPVRGVNSRQEQKKVLALYQQALEEKEKIEKAAVELTKN